jgi:hypothetical protein
MSLADYGLKMFHHHEKGIVVVSLRCQLVCDENRGRELNEIKESDTKESETRGAYAMGQ